MRKQHIFRPNGWNSLEVRITPSAVGPAPAALGVRIDAHVQHAKAHTHPVVHHKVHPAPPTVHHVTHQGGGTSGGGAYGGGSYGGGSYGGGSYGGY